MHVIRQQAVTEKMDFLLSAVMKQLLQVGGVVLVVVKNGLAVIPPRHDVIDCSRIFDSQRSGHAGKLTHYIHIFKPDSLCGILHKV
jgi:hypothetical protein